MLKPLLMMRTRGLSGPIAGKHAFQRSQISKSVGAFFSIYDSGDGGIPPVGAILIAAYPAETDVQDVNVVGEVMNIMPRGVVGADSLHNTDILSKDADGVHQVYPVNDPIWENCRTYHNEFLRLYGIYSSNSCDDLSNNITVAATTVFSGTETEVVVEAGTDSLLRWGEVATRYFVLGDTIEVSFAARGVGSTIGKIISVTSSAAGDIPPRPSITLTADWTRFSWTRPAKISDGPEYQYFILYGDSSSANILPGEKVHIKNVMLQVNGSDVNGYLEATDSSAITSITKSTDSDGAVDPITNEFVEAEGAALPNLWQVSNDATTNLLFPSEPPVNTTVTLPANEYTLWLEGVGSITSTYGAATEASPLTFTGNTLAELFTVVGSVDIAQIALGSSKGAYVRATTAAASIPATPYTYPAANIDPSAAHIAMTFDAGLEDRTLIDIGGVALLSYGNVGDGTEMLVNGSFDTDLSGWDGLWSWDAGSAVYNIVNRAAISQVVSTIPGDIYVAEYTQSGTATRFNGGITGASSYSSEGVIRYVFAAVDSPYIDIQSNNVATACRVDNISLQKVTKGLILSDGTNYSTVPLSAGTHKVEIILIDNTMQLILDSIPGPVVPYIPIPAGIITNTTPRFYAFSNRPLVTV